MSEENHDIPDAEALLETDDVLLGKMDLTEAKRLKTLLEPQRVNLVLYANPATCATGDCGCQVEVYAKTSDVSKVQALLNSERARDLEGLTIDAHLLNQVFDDAVEDAQCPACGTKFSTKLAECPDCGLGFGAM